MPGVTRIRSRTAMALVITPTAKSTRNVRGLSTTSGLARPTKYNRLTNAVSRRPYSSAARGRSVPNHTFAPSRYATARTPRPATVRSSQ